MPDFQKTIGEPVKLSGVGLHTGNKVNLTFKSAPEDSGFVFVRTDLEGSPQVEADANFVTSTDRGTTLEKKGVKVHTTEHVLAALIGMDLDNVLIEIDGSEPPIMDGSSKFFIEALEKTQIVVQSKEREYYTIKEIVSYQDPETGSEITAIPSEEYQLTVMVDFGTKILGTQNAVLKKMSNFKNEISTARTFSFLHELEQMLDAGLIKGGDLDNAIVYVDREISAETKEKLKQAFGKEDIVIKPNGVLDNLTLHYPNEAARHKLLDVIGDLALIGTRIKGKILATKPGHKINTNFAKKLKNQISIAKKKKVPEFDLTQQPVYDINAIHKILPHRSPFLLIDKIMEISDNHVIGVKNVTMNEPFFTGHFPSEPVMPGVLIIEAMAQTGGALTLHSVEDPENYSTYLIKIDKVKFKQKVIPGDVIIFKIDLIEPMRRSLVQMQGYAYVNGQIVAEAIMMAQIVKNKV
ncbi:MAG: UDP-3-O-[3-hydroxymyristoyl] N-acetylglucosamine deacetylase [Flavobacteriaceae bacterium]|nr:MAG: UDP-3-O-[3-hydroxymyristoyl] N-acetylglucosamine deacetylase [Flavobacteriaceae bacterium]